MPYYPNPQALPEHEEAVKKALIQFNFIKIPMPNTSNGVVKARDQWMGGGDHSNIPNNSFIEQPCGSHASPDFIVKANNKLYFIECKSSKGYSPTYNGGLPKNGYIYILCSEKLNATTIFLAQDVVHVNMRVLYNAMLNEINDIVVKYSKQFKLVDVFSRGFNFYMRAMYTQSGPSSNTNYFTHNDRAKCEQNVIDFVS